MKPPRTTAAALQHLRQNKAGVVFVGMCLSMAIGMVFQALLAARIGTAVTADVFYLGTTVPTLVATALLGSASSALIRCAVGTPRVLMLRRASSVPMKLLPLVLSVSTAMTLAGAALRFADVGLFAAPVRRGVGEFLLLTTPVPPLALLAAIGAVNALADRSFVRGTYGGAVNGIGLLLAALVFDLGHGDLTARELAIAVDCGYALQLAFVWPRLRRRPHLAASPPIGVDEAIVVRRAIIAFLVLAGASVVYKSQPLVERATGAFLGAGVPATLGYADKVTSGLMQLAVFGFAIAALPSLSRELADDDIERASNRLNSALLATFASAAAVIAFGVGSSGDLVRVFYERGAFDAHAAHVTHILILVALPSVLFGALGGPLSSLWYAADRVREVAVIGVGAFVISTGATAGLAVAIGYPGIVMGTAIGYAVTFAVFAWRARRVLESWSWRHQLTRVRSSLLAITLAVTGAGFVSPAAVPTITSSAPMSVLLLGVRLLLVLSSAFAALLFVKSRQSRRVAVTIVSPG